MANEVRKEFVIAVVALAVVAAIAIGIKFLNSGPQAGEADVPTVLNDMERQTPAGVPRISEEDASGDTIMMGGKK
ncbi:MAG: hypothetical protein M9921_04035 [Fimbriimonadaceae bacterium]|nr:hypothetical protein [Chthonomonadaceae bacterium]MCO5296005.1 hypothetical protein [Fimbriimonadaceae bacterium]